MSDEKNDTGFVVKDRRLFDEAGDTRSDNAASTAKDSPEHASVEAVSGPDPENEAASFLPEVNFANFVLSLSTTAMYHFGDFDDPESGTAAKNLDAAKHTIDTLGMLKEKTTGNLTPEESALLEGALFELRMRFVRESSAKA